MLLCLITEDGEASRALHFYAIRKLRKKPSASAIRPTLNLLDEFDYRREDVDRPTEESAIGRRPVYGDLLMRLALPSTGPLKTIAAFKAYFSAQGGDPARVEANERVYDGLRKAGMPEE
jgi:hypothetical protein